MEAVKIIEQALNLATKQGAFTLQDASTINNALIVLKNHFENDVKDVKEPTKKEK